MIKSRKTLDRVLAIVLSFLMLFSILPLNDVAAFKAVKTITVTVTDYWDNPIEGAEVTGYPVGLESECTEIVQTDASGKAVFTKFADYVTDETEFKYSIVKDGYETKNDMLSDTGDLFAGAYECKIKLLKQIEEYVTVDTYDGVYDGNEYGINVTCSIPGSVVEYFLPGDESAILDKSPVYDKVGEYNICFRVTGPEGYSDYVNYDTYVRIKAADITGVTVEALDTVYDGNEYPLVTVSGTAEGDIINCTIKGDEQEYKGIPKKDAAGNYEVTVTVDRGTNYNKFVQTVTAQIDLAELELGNIKIQGLEGTYNGEFQNAVSVTGQGDYTLQYKLGGEDWSGDIPVVIDAGSYLVQVKATKTNYNDKEVNVEKAPSAIYPFNIYVAKCDQTGFEFTNNTPAPLAYNDILENPAKGGQSGGKITYEVVDGDEYVTVDENGKVTAIKAGGNATIKAVIAGNDNYNEASATYRISTIKAAQTDFAFEQSSYTVQYGTDKLTVAAKGGQSGGSVTYDITDSDIASVTSAENKGNIIFNSGKKGVMTIKATLDGGENYEDITTEAKVEVISNDFSNKVIIDPDVPATGWYTDKVTIKAAAGYKISSSGQFSAEWKDSIVVASEGKNSINDVYLKEVATGYISEAIHVEDICIDKTAPTSLRISYSESIRDVVLENISFGFYDADMTVTLTATDYISKIDHLVYRIGDGEEVTVNKSALTFSGEDDETATASFNIPVNLSRSKITLTAYDAAGHYAEIIGNKTLVVDNVKPKISVSYDNNDVVNENYFNESRTATIRIAEENFFKDNLYDIITETKNKYLTIRVGKRLNNEIDYTYTDMEPEFIKVGDAYEAKVEFAEDADYTFDISFYDYSMNKNETVYYGDSKAPTAFTIDTTVPVIDVKFTEPPHSNGNQYRADREATITIKEDNFNVKDVVAEVTVKDAKEEVEVFDYAGYLSDDKNWESEGNVHTTKIRFNTEAHYTFDIAYTDLAGNQAADYEKTEFTIDKSAPLNMDISYSASVLDTILNAVTLGLYDKAFGFYNSEMEVTLTSYDDISGIDHFTYSYTVSEGGHKDDKGKSNVEISHDDITSEGGKSTAKFKIPAQFRGYVSFSATDKAGNTSELFTDDKCIVVDNKEAVVNVTYDNNDVKNEKYYNSGRKAIISISDDNFFSDSLYTPVLKNDENGSAVAQNENYLIIKVGKRQYTETEYAYTYKQPEFVKDGNFYKAVIDDFNENLDYTFDIKYTDKSLNVYDSYQVDEFRIDEIAPVIDVKFTEPPHSNGNQYRADREATITIKEDSFNAKDVIAEVTVKDAKGEVFDYAGYLSDNKNWESKGNVHTTTIPFNTEAHYTFDIAYTDLAGNQAADYEKTEFTIDKSAPADMDIRINNESVAGSMDTLAFDKFYSSAVTVKLSADCNISGQESFKYQKVSNVSEYIEDKNDENGVWLEYDAEKGIVVKPSEKFIIYFRAEDRAGNVSIIRSTGIVTDDQKPVGEIKAPEIDIVPKEPNTNGIYNGDVVVDFKVIDPKYIGNEAASNGHHSGLNEITYKIYTTDTDVIETGTMFAFGETTDGAEFDTDGLVNKWSGSITIDSAKFNSNNVIVEVTAVDNAGNTRTSSTGAGEIKIDITAPKIEVSYNNNDADSGSYFDADRIATIVVEERNFREEDIELSLTNTDGMVPKLSEWTKTEGSGNLDNTKWTASINYSADGDYDFSIGYTDLAGWTCDKESVEYGSSVAPEQFTIDKTAPTVNVSYDNNSALNSNYYKEARVATVVINEHNLEPNGADRARIVITMSAADDGQNIAIPSVSAWRTEGDTHTATISYSDDALYSFDIEITDKAGNVSAEFEEQSFYVDQTAPVIEITGIADNSANNSVVMPVVSYSDTNYDSEQVTITLTGAKRNAVALDGNYTDIHNGRTFTFKNFAEDREVDDIYTLTAALTDKAGNTTTETVKFSVNRFGSTYAMSELAGKLNGTYVKEPVDVVITETNVNELKNFKITLFKNNDTIVLKEGEDYKIDVTGGNGAWYYYTYTVFAKNFTDDGVYRLAFHSEDSAGNIAENTLDTKDTEVSFGVDKTKPNIVVANIEGGTTYALENMTVNMSVSDNLVLSSITVYLDDYSKAYKTWTAEEISAIIAENGEFTFDIAGDSKNAHKIKIVSVDAAGNEQVEEITNFFVTTDIWVRYYNNKILFFGTIAGVIALAGAIVFLIVYRRKRKSGNS